MTIYSLFGSIGVIALLTTIVTQLIRKTDSWPITFFRFFVGFLLIFSGIVKAIDPVGTAIKMEEYFEIFHEYVPFLGFLWTILAHNALVFSIFVIVLEIFLGFAFVFGVFKKFTLWSSIAMMVFFTVLTGFSHVTGKVTDCGCFGDFIKLVPKTSFFKDVILTSMLLILYFGRDKINYLGGQSTMKTLSLMTTIFALIFTLRNYYDLPIKDFRAYKIGTNIPECTTLGQDAKQEIKEMVFVYKDKASGEVQEFAMNNLPKDLDKYEFVDRKDKLIQKGDEAKCKDFAILDDDGSDWSEEYLYMKKPLVVISSYQLNKSSNKGFEKVKAFIDAAEADGLDIIAITGSSLSEAEAFRHEKGLAVDFYNTDAVPIKTMNRSNPGITLIEDGTIVNKWHHRKLPDYGKFKKDYLN